MEIRQANEEDSTALAKVQVDSYLTTYAEIFPSAYLEHFTYEEQEQDWRDWFVTNQHPLFVAVTNQGEVIGYGLGQSNAEEVLPYESEFVALHVRKEHQRHGLGRRLMAAVSKELSAQGCGSLFLWVLADNPACRFYENLGGEIVGEKAWRNNAYFDTEIREVAYGWLDIRSLIDHD